MKDVRGPLRPSAVYIIHTEGSDLLLVLFLPPAFIKPEVPSKSHLQMERPRRSTGYYARVKPDATSRSSPVLARYI